MNNKSKSLKPLFIVLGLSAAFFIAFVVIASVFFLSDKDSEDASQTLFSTNNAVAVVEVKGVILDSKSILKKLRRFEKNKRVKAVVLRLNSPGGAVAPSQEIYEAVKNFEKPIVASMGSVAASGAYYIACGAQKVFANAGTITGSIGVIMEFMNTKDLYDWAKVKRYSISTGKYKNIGSTYKEMTSDERNLLQTMIDDVLMQFKQAVSEGRKLSMAEVAKVADGRIFSGNQAYQLKLVDEVGTLKAAINEAAKLAKIEGEPKVIYPRKNNKRWFLEFLMDDDPDQQSVFSSLLMKLYFLDKVTSQMPVQGALPAYKSFNPGIYWLWNGAR